MAVKSSKIFGIRGSLILSLRSNTLGSMASKYVEEVVIIFCQKKNDVKTAKYLLKRQENPVNLLKLVNSCRSGRSVRLGRAVVAE